MIQEKDYLMRLLMVFMQKLAELLSRKKLTDIAESDIKVFYSEAFDDTRNNILNLSSESLFETCKDKEVVSVEKCRILAELLYIESMRSTDALEKKDFAKKSLGLFEYCIQHSKTYDFNIVKKMNQLEQITGD